MNIIHARTVRLRLQCKCGTVVTVTPKDFKHTVFFCPNCSETWPGTVPDNHLAASPAQRLAVALRDLQREVETTGYVVAFEAE